MFDRPRLKERVRLSKYVCVRAHVCVSLSEQRVRGVNKCACVIQCVRVVHVTGTANRKREKLPETATPPPYVIGREDLEWNGYGKSGYHEISFGERCTGTLGMQPIYERT